MLCSLYSVHPCPGKLGSQGEAMVSIYFLPEDSVTLCKVSFFHPSDLTVSGFWGGR